MNFAGIRRDDNIILITRILNFEQLFVTDLKFFLFLSNHNICHYVLVVMMHQWRNAAGRGGASNWDKCPWAQTEAVN